MSTFAGSRLTADDVMALHTRYHDAMHGTLAPEDQHRHQHHQHNLHYGTLPRPLRSYHTHRSGDVSTLSDAAQPTSAASAFRTPQWSEFSECVREVSPPTANGEEEDDINDLIASHQEKNDDEASTRVARRAGASPQKRISAAVAAGHDVVDRLAALSQSPHADAMAVAAALREAEELLSQGKSVAAMTGETYRGEALPRRNHRSQHRRLPFADRDVLHEKAAASHQAPYPEQLWKEAAEEHHQRQPENHASLQAPPPPPAWPWPTSPTEGSSFTPAPSPQWPAAAASTTSPQLTGFEPPPMSSAGVLDATAHWYEVYYAWMLYYQQLYAAQIQQYEQAQRREARRARSQHRHRHRHGRQQQDDHVSRGTSRTRAADTEGSHPHHGDVLDMVEGHCVAGASREREDRRERGREARHDADQRDHSRRMGKRDTMTSGDSVGGSAPDNRLAETQQLRAELRQLEKKLAALSATAVATDEETSHYQSRSQRSPPPRSGAGKARAGAGRERRVRPASASPSPERVASHSVVVRPAPAKPAAAAVTWQALSERQRSRSAAGDERQRPQWR